jgi:thiol-disulfide isomerase/thioredoxin
MARGKSLSGPKSSLKSGLKSGSTKGDSQSYLWIIFCLILLGIILFAIFYPRRQYSMSLQNGNMMQAYPMMRIESFENSDENSDENLRASLMEKEDDEDNIQEILAYEKPCLIFFYAPWCGHCTKAMPEYQKVKKADKCKAFKINGDKYKELSQEHNITGFPTIRYYPKGLKNGNPSEYEGNRTAEDILKFIQ